MESPSVWPWLLSGSWAGLLLLAVWVGPAVLFSRVLARAGYPGWWSLIGLVPVINVICLWVFAFVPWPSERDEAPSSDREGTDV